VHWGWRGRGLWPHPCIHVGNGRARLSAMELERRLLELGFVEGAESRVLSRGHSEGDPIAVRVNDNTIALPTPGGDGHPRDLTGTRMTTATETTAWRFALVGTPNSGRPRLFNR